MREGAGSPLEEWLGVAVAATVLGAAALPAVAAAPAIAAEGLGLM
jgi:hypothetical protein